MKTRQTKNLDERRKENKQVLNKWLRYFETDLHNQINEIRKELKESK